MKRSNFGQAFEVKNFDSESGKFSGYISRFDEVDGGNDVVLKGAFLRSLKQHRENKRTVPVLWQHDHGIPIGRWLDLKEDNIGLFGEGELAIGVQKAEEARTLMKMDVATGISMGYTTRRKHTDEKTKVRSLIEVDLWEGSIVTFPMLDTARVETVKSLQEVMTIRDCEDWLRDVTGLSQKEAKDVISKIKAAGNQRDVGDENVLSKKLSRIVDSLNNL